MFINRGPLIRQCPDRESVRAPNTHRGIYLRWWKSNMWDKDRVIRLLSDSSSGPQRYRERLRQSLCLQTWFRSVLSPAHKDEPSASLWREPLLFVKSWLTELKSLKIRIMESWFYGPRSVFLFEINNLRKSLSSSIQVQVCVELKLRGRACRAWGALLCPWRVWLWFVRMWRG